jgi:Bacteriocin-protection, YdeI or OmpD-Associated
MLRRGVQLDTEPRVVVEPADLARVLDADPVARSAFDRLAYGRKLQQVRAIESAKKPETRERRIEKAVAMLRGESGLGIACVRPAPSAFGSPRWPVESSPVRSDGSGS